MFNLYSFYNVRLNIVNIFLDLKYAIPTYYFYVLFVRFVFHSNVKRQSSACKSLYMGDQVRGQRVKLDSHKAKRHALGLLTGAA